MPMSNSEVKTEKLAKSLAMKKLIHIEEATKKTEQVLRKETKESGKPWYNNDCRGRSKARERQHFSIIQWKTYRNMKVAKGTKRICRKKKIA